MTATPHVSLPVKVDITEPWDGTAAGATPLIDWVLANGGTARYHGKADTVDNIPRIMVDTFEGTTDAHPGDRLIRGTRGEFYPIKPLVYADKYRPLDDSLPTTNGSVIRAVFPLFSPDDGTITESVVVLVRAPLERWSKSVWVNVHDLHERYRDEHVAESGFTVLYRADDLEVGPRG